MKCRHDKRRVSVIYTGLGIDLPSSEGLELTIDEEKPLASRMDQRKEAFAVAAVEGFNQIKTGKLVELSEQELVNCDVNNGN
ncbi:hypothetical protein RJ639_044661 [Escallonia herrerae]|uniref:Peptidase C1A papain C-terminal domain-containing protein n=1 Tax=Escallonia herrerae TaxID=1293975 RepID=A0AA88WCU2_9ASTE|nr:hypothetical protein RJ639_044661 [Escallonia herrerae]